MNDFEKSVVDLLKALDEIRFTPNPNDSLNTCRVKFGWDEETIQKYHDYVQSRQLLDWNLSNGQFSML